MKKNKQNSFKNLILIVLILYSVLFNIAFAQYFEHSILHGHDIRKRDFEAREELILKKIKVDNNNLDPNDFQKDVYTKEMLPLKLKIKTLKETFKLYKNDFIVNYYPKLNYVLTEYNPGEGHYNILINLKTGDKQIVYSNPIFSPDAKYFADVSADIESGYVPNHVKIYQTDTLKEVFYNGSKANTNFQLEKGPRYGAINFKWISNTEATFDRYYIYGSSNSIKGISKIKFQDDAWEISHSSNKTPEIRFLKSGYIDELNRTGEYQYIDNKYNVGTSLLFFTPKEASSCIGKVIKKADSKFPTNISLFKLDKDCAKKSYRLVIPNGDPEKLKFTSNEAITSEEKNNIKSSIESVIGGYRLANSKLKKKATFKSIKQTIKLTNYVEELFPKGSIIISWNKISYPNMDYPKALRILTVTKGNTTYPLKGGSFCLGDEKSVFIYNFNYYFIALHHGCESGWMEWDLWNLSTTPPIVVEGDEAWP